MDHDEFMERLPYHDEKTLRHPLGHGIDHRKTRRDDRHVAVFYLNEFGLTSLKGTLHKAWKGSSTVTFRIKPLEYYEARKESHAYHSEIKRHVSGVLDHIAALARQGYISEALGLLRDCWEDLEVAVAAAGDKR